MKINFKSFDFRKIFLPVQLIFIFFWAEFLLDTYSYFSPYLCCALLSTVCACLRYGRSDRWKKSEIVILSVASLLFSIAVTLANYALYLPMAENRFRIVTVFLGGIFVAWNILAYFARADLFHPKEHRVCKTWKPLTVFFVSFAVIAAIDLIYLFFSVYPGTLTTDSLTQIDQIVNGYTSNHHPFWHSVVISLFYNTGLSLFGTSVAGVALYSVASALFMAACFAYALSTLYRAGASKAVLLLCGAGYALLPYHIAYSVTMWKDVVFGGAVLLFVVTLYRGLKKIGRPVLNLIGLFFCGVAVGVWRSNGWLALVAFAVCLVLYCVIYKQKLIATVLVVCGAVVISWFMKGPVLSMMNVSQPDLVESLSIPVQQVARVISEGYALTDEEYDLLSQVVDVEEIPEIYQFYISDPVKNEIRSKNQQYLIEHKFEYLKLWINLGLKYPGEYVKAWVDQTRGYFNGGYRYWIYSQGINDPNDFSLSTQVQPNRVQDWFQDYFDEFYDLEILQPLHSVGLHVWIVFGAFVVCVIKKRPEMLLCIVPLMIVGTLLVATPVYCEFRYAYSIFTSLPFLAVVCLSAQNTSSEKGE